MKVEFENYIIICTTLMRNYLDFLEEESTIGILLGSTEAIYHNIEIEKKKTEKESKKYMRDAVGFVTNEHVTRISTKCRQYILAYNTFGVNDDILTYLQDSGMLHQQDINSPKYSHPGEGEDQKGVEGVIPFKAIPW